METLNDMSYLDAEVFLALAQHDSEVRQRIVRPMVLHHSTHGVLKELEEHVVEVGGHVGHCQGAHTSCRKTAIKVIEANIEVLGSIIMIEVK